MTISMIFAWISVLFGILLLTKFIARISHNKKFNQLFHKFHLPLGIILFITALIHSLLAGNSRFSTLSNIQIGNLLFTWNWGTACFVTIIILGLTYFLRKKLGRCWMTCHRIASILFILCLVLHLLDIGIQLPGRIINIASENTSSQVAESNTAEPGSLSSSDSASNDTSDSSSNSDSGSSSNSDSASNDTSDSSSNSDSDSSSSSDSASNDTSDSSIVTFSGAQLSDGTYEGSAEGFQSTITVSVVVADGTVTEINVVSENDTPQFFSRAESLLDTIIAEQSLEVDAVSGATFSSSGLLNAIQDALTPAVISGTLEITDIDLSSVNRGHGGGKR